MKETPTPTKRELEILKVLWEDGPCSVRDVHRKLSPSGDPAYNTIQTLIRIMEGKRLVKHRVKDRKFIYEARYSREESTVHFLDRVFDGAASELVLTLLQAERIPPDELEQMHAMIAEARRHNGGGGGNP